VDKTQSVGKPFEIPKRLIWRAYLKVKDNKGSAGVDGQSLAEFEQDLKGNLYKLWNRMSSGSYFPAPVKAVPIPKSGGGTRVLGVPGVADRIAQTAATMVLEPLVEPLFHPDSYGYRPRRSALDAVERCKQRCWRRSWVVDLDIQGFFDNVPHAEIMAAVKKHTDVPWVVLYVNRWLLAPMQHPDGRRAYPAKGTPQGSAISPLLSNLFLHYALDAWLVREYPMVQFERYCDDVILHCSTRRQAEFVRRVVEERLAEFGLRCHPEKTCIVYCKQDGRDDEYPVTCFTFLGFDFRRAPVRRRDGVLMCGFVPLVGRSARKSMSRVIRQWRLGRRTDLGFRGLAAIVNPVVSGWINYYGRFYKSELVHFLEQRINPFLVKWMVRKYKRLRRAKRRARRKLAEVASAFPALFAHWRHGARPTGSTVGAV
jgi:RNA-directed DNA polymerase